MGTLIYNNIEVIAVYFQLVFFNLVRYNNILGPL
jgi:hypothetical protein